MLCLYIHLQATLTLLHHFTFLLLHSVIAVLRLTIRTISLNTSWLQTNREQRNAEADKRPTNECLKDTSILQRHMIWLLSALIIEKISECKFRSWKICYNARTPD